mgnify:CR=1 FL=1
MPHPAIHAGFWPAIYASFASAIAFNFFFLPPLYGLSIADKESVIALGFFLIVGITASNLTAGVRATEVHVARAPTDQEGRPVPPHRSRSAVLDVVVVEAGRVLGG